MKVTATVDRLRRAGVEVIDFGAGEPDFPTPAAIKAAAHAAIDRNFTQVHAGRRHRRAEARDLRPLPRRLRRRVHGVARSSSRAGGKQALFNTALALFGPGDEVITHAPYWPTLTEQVKLADATPVLVRTVAGGRLRDPRRRRSSTRSRRGRAASSSTRRATRPAR